MASANIETIHDRNLNVNFVCQRCSQPLRLDTSYTNIEDQLFTELSSSHHKSSYPDDSWEKDQSDIYRRYIPPIRLSDNGNGFEVVGETLPPAPQNLLSHQLNVAAELFDILSDQSEVDHPLCEECTDYLLDQMDNQLRMAEEECREYKLFFEQLEAEPVTDNIEELETELNMLKGEEETLIRELDKVEAEQKEIEKDLNSKKKEEEELRNENERFWQEYSDYQVKLMTCLDELQSVQNQLHYSSNHLQKLKTTNVFNATFHIWHHGHFGTINNFRLGRLSSHPVEWNEINAAWGQTVLLLHSLAKKINLTFKRYRLVPYGNHSFLESLDDKTKELPLYCAGGFRFFWDSKFDLAMVAFLDCLEQFKQEVEKIDNRFHLPYRMERGKIEDTSMKVTFSIKIQLNSEEQWTKALKFMLTNLKWALAWVSAQFKDEC